MQTHGSYSCKAPRTCAKNLKQGLAYLDRTHPRLAISRTQPHAITRAGLSKEISTGERCKIRHVGFSLLSISVDGALRRASCRGAVVRIINSRLTKNMEAC